MNTPFVTPEQLSTLTGLWTSNISDPGPDAGQWRRWLRSFPYDILLLAVNATIRRYQRDPETIDFEGCCRFTSATARRKADETAAARVAAKAFQTPAEWTDKHE